MSRPPLNDQNNNQGLVNLGNLPSKSAVAAFNLAGIDNLLETKGFLCLHAQHALLPDRDSLRAPDDPNTKTASVRGVMYYSLRELYTVPQSFKIEDRLSVQGIFGIGSVLFNIAGNYNDGEKDKVHAARRDLLIFPSLTDKARQLLEWNPTGPMKLHYKVKAVELLFDRENQYNQGLDFVVDSGMIVWLKDGKKPKFVNGQPSILSCVYYYTPIYIIQSLPHSMRVLPSNSQGNAALPRDASYAPQLCVAKPSTLLEENDILDWQSIPGYSAYPDSLNLTGGSF